MDPLPPINPTVWETEIAILTEDINRILPLAPAKRSPFFTQTAASLLQRHQTQGIAIDQSLRFLFCCRRAYCTCLNDNPSQNLLTAEDIHEIIDHLLLCIFQHWMHVQKQGQGPEKNILDRIISTFKQTESKYINIFENIVEGIFQSTIDGKFVTANLAMAKILGYESPQELIYNVTNIGQQIYLRPEDRESVIAELREKGEINQRELQFKRKDGTIFYGLLSLKLAHLSPHQDPILEGILLDITERKILEYQIMHNQKLESLGELAAGIAHEINTPIQYIGDNLWYVRQAWHAIATWIASLPQPPEAISSYLHEMPAVLTSLQDGLQRISTIVHSMRGFSYPGECHQPTDLNALVEQAMVLTRHEWKHVAQVTTDLDPQLPPIRCAQQEILQVLINLIINAAQAMEEQSSTPEYGRIHISTQSTSQGVKICIRDNGPGMPPEVLVRIFDPFFTTKAPGKGTGQGLFIAYRIITRNHNGTIHCSSSPGQGAYFTIQLPEG
jgi:two-component system NtrC family sensor kinase